MKIKMTVYNMRGTAAEIEGVDIGLEVHGKRFIVHKAPFGCGGWTVTETSTGAGVCTASTKKAVIEKARLRLAKVSAEEMETACAKAKENLDEVLRKYQTREREAG